MDTAPSRGQLGRAGRSLASWRPDRAGAARMVQRYWMLLFGAAMIVVFSALRPSTFATVDNARSILNNQTVLILIALAAMVPLIVGGFDLSITATLSLSSVLIIGLQGRTGLPWELAILVCLLIGGAIGVVNGMLVAYGRLNAFVVTLATSTIIGGMTLWYTDGQVLFLDIDPDFISAGRDTIGGLVQPLFLCIAVVVVLWYFLESTAPGRQMYATGSNPNAARLAGLRTSRLVIAAFAMAGVLAALAGVVQSAKIGSGQPDIGAGYLLPAFASAFLGASAVKPGRFNPLGTIIGVYLVAIGFTGLVLLGVDLWVQPVFYGLVLLTAIAAPRLVRVRRKGVEEPADPNAMLMPAQGAERPAGDDPPPASTTGTGEPRD